MKPRLAAFPKAFMDPLCVTGAMSLTQWIDLAATLDIDGLEFYSGFLEFRDPAKAPQFRKIARDAGLAIPMLCCSPDFTHPDPSFRQKQIDLERSWIDMTAALGGQFCRVLSGQRRPEVSRADGIRYAAECIEACLPHAAARGVTLVIENHYKDNYWQFPEFAQKADVFCELVGQPSADAGTTCSASGTMVADYLTSASAFPAYLHAVGCSCLASLQLDFTVSNKGSTRDAYELTDTVFLRNSTRL